MGRPLISVSNEQPCSCRAVYNASVLKKTSRFAFQGSRNFDISCATTVSVILFKLQNSQNFVQQPI